MPTNRGTLITKVIKALKFIIYHRQWSISDLKDELNISYSSALEYFEILSTEFPIKEIRPFKNRRYGKLSALYSLTINTTDYEKENLKTLNKMLLTSKTLKGGDL